MASTINFGSDNSGFQVGINHGTVNSVHHYSAPEPFETPPEPSNFIPFGRDRDFVSRGDILNHIHQACAVPGSRVALVGLGGVGKSQIAIEYAYQVRDQSPETWVFWVHASNAARYEQSFREIAEYAKIPGRRDPQNNIFELVSNWLRSETKRKWKLIIDNVDVTDFLFDDQGADQSREVKIERASSLPLAAYLPYCDNGSILITTRSKHVAQKLVEPDNNIIVLNPMTKSEALALVETKLGSNYNSDSAAGLVVALEYMPLAIVQATAYISQRTPRCSVRQYLEIFEKSDRKKVTLLDYEGGQLRRDREAKNSIIITWQISFDHIRRSRPSAADLLALMSYFDRQGIPESLLRTRDDDINTKISEDNSSLSDIDEHENGEWDSSSSESSNHDTFEDDLLMLRNYSFVSVTENTNVFEMHRLVQIATRKWLAIDGQEERWKEQFVSNLSVHLPNGEYENWTSWQALLPHAKAAVTYKLKSNAALLDWTSVLYLTAWYYKNMGNFYEAEKISILAMNVRIRLLGRNNVNTLNSMALVGSTYQLRGRWEEAEKLEVEVMETSKQRLGADHPDTLTSITNLASTFWNQGRWEEAEKLEVEVMETLKQKLGADHPNTLTSMANLASTFWNQGRWEEAEKLQVEVMETSKQKLGADHPTTLTSMGNLAMTFWNQGRAEEAEKLQVEVMETSKQRLGADHPDTLSSMNNLAFTWHMQDRYAEALNLMKDCVQRRRNVLGVDHPDYISSAETPDYWRLPQTYSDATSA